MTATITEDDLKEAKDWGNKLANHTDQRKNKIITTSQLRKFMSQINRLRQKAESINDEQWESFTGQVYMLQPRLAYQFARTYSGDLVAKEFKDVLLKKLADSTNSREDYLKFSNFYEAVVAYHKAYGGKEK